MEGCDLGVFVVCLEGAGRVDRCGLLALMVIETSSLLLMGAIDLYAGGALELDALFVTDEDGIAESGSMLV